MPPPFLVYPDTTAGDHPHPHMEQTGQAGTTPTAHPDHEPASEAPHTRQARHTGTKDYRLGRSIPSRMRRHTQPRRKAPGNDTIAWHPPARACPRIHNDALPAHRAGRAPASGIRRMPRHTHLKKLPGPHGKPGRTPAAGEDAGMHVRCPDTHMATTPAGIISNNPGSYMFEKHQTLNTGDRNCTECLTVVRYAPAA